MQGVQEVLPLIEFLVWFLLRIQLKEILISCTLAICVCPENNSPRPTFYRVVQKNDCLNNGLWSIVTNTKYCLKICNIFAFILYNLINGCFLIPTYQLYHPCFVENCSLDQPRTLFWCLFWHSVWLAGNQLTTIFLGRNLQDWKPLLGRKLKLCKNFLYNVTNGYGGEEEKLWGSWNVLS